MYTQLLKSCGVYYPWDSKFAVAREGTEPTVCMLVARVRRRGDHNDDDHVCALCAPLCWKRNITNADGNWVVPNRRHGARPAKSTAQALHGPVVLGPACRDRSCHAWAASAARRAIRGTIHLTISPLTIRSHPIVLYKIQHFSS